MVYQRLFAYVTRDGDDPITVLAKKIVLVGGVLGAVTAIGSFGDDTSKSVFEVMRRLLGMIASIVQVVQMIVERKFRPAVTEVLLYSLATTILCGDLVQAVKMDRNQGWPFFVIFIDVCLVCRLPSRVARNLIVLLISYLLLVALESSMRFGLFDLPILPPQSERGSFIDCTNYPCPFPLAHMLVVFYQQVVIFLFDFYITRRFAHDLYREHEKMNKVIAATEDIATSLSRFDLDAAEEVITTASLPPPLFDAFSSILSNLKNYRPYLPDALFSDLHSSLAQGHDPPGLQSQRAALVFTDIQGSTATWEACPDGMKEGLRVHNKAMRDCITEHNGYEVKTIGDAFMVAFESVYDAVWFSLSAQEKLVTSMWPDKLLDLEQCAWQDHGPWSGLRVRIGVHYGSVDVQRNTITGRYDYFGNTVNKAARVEGACVGGAVAVTPEVLEETGYLDSVEVIEMEEMELKGVREMVKLSLLLPLELLGRKGYVQQQLDLRKRGRPPSPQGSFRVSHGSVTSHGSRNSIFSMLRKTQQATVSSVEVLLPSYESGAEVGHVINKGLVKVLTNTERSHGAVLSLQGSRLALCWNGPKPCSDHVGNALTFVKMLGRTASFGSGATIHVGVCTSSILHGTVGDHNQKFVTVLGNGMLGSTVLCSNAVTKKVLCFYASARAPEEMEGLNMSKRGVYIAPDMSNMLQMEFSCDDQNCTPVSTFDSPPDGSVTL
eukprot:TRINITY_DN3528_c0_g1_i11.p1 TRINITY_DN3528_c0_g1~~TRINITY_DN3528_c0_g1_i11.p1  ORF type:complete len:719 (+),score=121.88 TRINITY_DN3528_c0_g1_i11:78-2234(+)